MEVVAMEPARLLAFGCESNGFRYRMEMSFVPKGPDTTMQMRFQAEGLTFFGKVMGVVMKPFAKKMMSGCGKDLDDIAAIAEGR
jgi:hypothetical protein